MTVIYTDGAIDDVTKNLISGGANPTWTGVTPSDLGSQSVKDVSFDRTSIKPPIGAYSLAADDTDSEFRYTADSFAKPVVWTPGSPFSGEYSILRSASTPGSVLAYGTSTSTPFVFDFLVNDGGWSSTSIASRPNYANPAIYVALTGWQSVDDTPEHDDQTMQIVYTFSSPTDIGSATVTFTASGSNGGVDTRAVIWERTDHSLGSALLSLEGGTHTNSVTINETILAIAVNVNTPLAVSTDPNTVTKVVLNSGNAQVIYSDDYGATVGSAIDLGSSPGAFGAFDLLPIGGASIAAAAGQVMLATTLGGSYSNTPSTGGTLASGNPVALVLPVRTLPHGSYQTNSTTPDFIMGADTDNSGESLWMVTGAGSRTDITPVSGCTIAPHCLTSWQTSSTLHIQVVINDSGTYKLYTYNGSTWTYRRDVTDPRFLRYKRQGNPVLYLIDGSTLYISYNHGAKFISRTTPSSDPGVAMDIYG